MTSSLDCLLLIALFHVSECIVIKTPNANVWPTMQTKHDDTRYKQLVAQVFNITQNTPNSKSINEPRPCPIGARCVPHHLCSADAQHPDTDADNQLEQKVAVVQADADRFCNEPTEVCCTELDATITGQPSGCGHQLPQRSFESRISGGWQTGIGEFPWMIAILERNGAGNKYKYLCGGSLIHPSIVLTAGHTIAARSLQQWQLIGRGGEWDLQSSAEQVYRHEDRTVVRAIIHAQFNNKTLANDIALLQLDRPFQIGTNVNTICLPPANVFTDANVRCTATGWGRNQLGAGGRYQSVMQRIDMPIVAHWTCQNRLRMTRLGRHYRLHRGFLCAGGERGNDTCKGDGGSPLVCRVPNEPNRFYQAGIVAGGIGCGRGVPGIYVNTAWYINWIWRQMHSMGINAAVKDSLHFDDFF